MIIKIEPKTEKGKEAIASLNKKYNNLKNRVILKSAGVTLAFADDTLKFTYGRLLAIMEKLGPQFKAEMRTVIDKNKEDILTEMNALGVTENIDYVIGVE